MKSLLRFIAPLMVLSLTGCLTYSLEELRHTTPSGSPFQNALSKQYLQFASDEEKAYDWYSAVHFADKGLSLAYGKDVEPEDPAAWSGIPADLLPRMQAAREQLMELLATDMVTRDADTMAQAQLYFDCWVENQDENWQSDEITRCRDGFTDMMAILSVPLSPDKATLDHPLAKAHAKAAKSEETPKAAKAEETPKPKAVTIETASYVVLFDKGGEAITLTGEQAMAQVLADLMKQTPGSFEIILKGPAGQGGDAASLTLFANRAQAVKTRLAAAGVSPDAILLPGADATPAPGIKQRIEIFLND